MDSINNAKSNNLKHTPSQLINTIRIKDLKSLQFANPKHNKKHFSVIIIKNKLPCYSHNVDLNE